MTVPKKQRQYYSGKKKRHTVKIQVIYGRETEKIISIRTGMGARHDMRLAKKHLAELYPYKIVIADKGYQGLAKTGLQTPKKKSKHHPLNKQDKEANRRLGKLRTVIEHINRKLKMVRDYMKNSWNADIDLLRNAILRRGGKISTLDLNSLN